MISNEQLKPTGTPAESSPTNTFNEHVDRCLSPVLHFPEVQELAALIKKIHHERQRSEL